MATFTIRTNLASATLSVAAGEFLEYRLKPKGSRANFAWTDNAETGILTHINFGLADELVWQLKASLGSGGRVAFSVPQNSGYARTEAPGARTNYTLTLFFVTANGYTLTVKQFDRAGQFKAFITDIDLAKDSSMEDDSVDQGLELNV